MKIEVIGASGAPAPGRLPMTLLVDSVLMIDAGSVASGLDPARAGDVKTVLLSHAHLDHVRELGFLPFRRDPEKDGLLDIVSTPGVLRAVRQAVFNRDFWIDFEAPAPPRQPGIRYRDIAPETPFTASGFRVEAVPLTHAGFETSGFILEKEGRTAVYALDSGPTGRIWTRAKERETVHAVFYDVSFPDRFAAGLDEHMTPSGLAREVAKLAPHTPRVLAVHLKPEHRAEILAELDALPFAVETPEAGDMITL